MFGFLGIGFALFIQALILSNLKSFGVPYLSPYLPVSKVSGENNYILPPTWKRENRPDFLNTKKEKAQNKISRKWMFYKGDDN